jgi:hypothetical protein
MKNVKIELTNIEIQVIRGILFEYYVTLKQEYMCDEESEAHASLEYKFAQAETESFRS